MTEAELWHMALLATEDLQAILETLLTVLSAYLAAAYFVGKKLTRFQAALVSSLFVAAAGVAGFLSVVMWRRTVYFLDQLVDRFGVESFAPNRLLIALFAITLALFVPACVVFMYQIRRHPPLGAEQE